MTKSTSGFFSCPTNRFANVDMEASNRRCPSAYTVSNANDDLDDLPEPLTPVTTISLSRQVTYILASGRTWQWPGNSRLSLGPILFPLGGC